MRNLKRALSLLLAAAMLIGMMVVGASAAGSLDDFSDKDEIVNQDAVSLLTILGVIEGKEDGSYFDPTGNVTRAEMAKMIATILNQGADVDGLYVGMNTGLTDVSGHWAESYINYCYSLGIIAGRGNGTFDPTATVTGTEAAKMLLVAAGYDASIEGLEGADWAIRTAALASTLGIFDNLNAPTGDPLTRDNAALLVYNALDIEMIQSYQNGYAIAYSDNRTLLSTKYGVYRIEGTVVGNEWAQLEETDSDAAMAEGKTRLTDVKLIDSDTVNTRPGVDDGQSRPDTTFNVSTPVDYLGQTVTMYVRNTTVLANSEVLGVYLKDGANVIYNSADTEDTMKDFLKGTGLSTDADTEYYVNYGYMASQGAATAAMDFEMATGRFASVNGKLNAYGVEMTVIDNDQDGIVDYVLYLQESLSQVTAKNTAKETTTLVGFNSNKAIDDEDIVAADEVAEGDLALVVSYGGRYYVSAPEVVNGQMESFQASKTKEQTIKVSGTDYHPSYIQYEAITADNTYEFNIAQCDTDDGVQFDTTYDFILDSNGNVIAYRPSEQGLYDYALVLESGYEPGAFASDATGKVTVLLPDGSESTYTLNFSASAKNIGEQIADHDGKGGIEYSKNQGIQELKAFLGTADSDKSTTAPWATSQGSQIFAKQGGNPDTDFNDGQAVGYVIGYSLNDNDVLTITSIVGANIGNGTPAVDTYSSAIDSKLSADYSTGAARIRYGTSSQVTIDKNTVAFYYVDENTYGVAVGYNEMADVDATTEFVAGRVRNTNLASVVLFDAEGKQAEKDYVYVLSKNTVGPNQAILNVVYMDGTVGEMTIDRDNYDDVFDSDAKFGTAYAYKADGNIYEIDETGLTVVEGYALKLRNGSVALYDAKAMGTGDFVDSYSYEENIWNVENVDGDDEKAPATDFSTNVGKEVVLVLDTAGDKVRAAYIQSTLTEEADGGFVGDVELDEPIIEMSRLASVQKIQDAFDDGYNVLIDDDYKLSGDLIIPRNRGLQVTGDFDMDGNAVDSTGTLIVDGTLATGTDAGDDMYLVGTVKAKDLLLEDATVIAGSVSVTNNVDTNGNTLSVDTDRTLNVDGDMVGTDAVTVLGTLNVKGNVANDVTADPGKITINGNLTGEPTIDNGGSITVKGNVSDDVTLTEGSLSVGGNLTGVTSDITVDADKALSVGGNMSTTGDITIDDGKTLEVGGDLAVAAVTVTDGKLTVGDEFNASGAVAVTKGSVVVNGKVVAGSTIAIDAGASMTVKDNLTATSGATTVEGNLTVGGKLDANGQTVTVGDGTTAAALNVTGKVDATTLTINKAEVVIGDDVTANVRVDDASSEVGIDGDVTGTVTLNNGELTVGDVSGALTLNAGTLNLNGTNTTGITVSGADINLGADAVLKINASVSAVNISGITLTGEIGATVSIKTGNTVTVASNLFYGPTGTMTTTPGRTTYVYGEVPNAAGTYGFVGQ